MINVPLTYLSLYLVLTVVFLLSSGNQKIKTTGWLFSVIALVLIIGLRGVDIGDDTKEYISSFEQNRFRETVSYELTWKYICIFVKDILGGGIQWVLIIYSTITVIPITIVCRKKSPYPYLSLLLFIILGYAFHSMNIMRQAVAISYSLLLLYEIEEKHYMGAAISFAIAVLFHSSALVIVPLLLCAYGFKKIPLNIQLILLFVSLLIGSLFYAKINSLAGLLTYEKYQNYQYYSDNRGANISNLLIMNTVKTLIAILLLSRAKTKSLFIDVFSLSIFLTNIIGYNIGLNRVLYYISIAAVIAIPQIFKSINIKEDPFFIVKYITPIAYMSVSFVFFGYSLSHNVDGVFPF